MSLPPTSRGGRAVAAYVSDAVETATPQQLVLRLYDRLVVDLDRAASELRTAHEHPHDNRHAAPLVHAQEVILELRASLDVSAWSGAPALAGLYAFLLSLLTQANIGGGPVAARLDLVEQARTLVIPLRDAWHGASAATAVSRPLPNGHAVSA